MNWFARLEVDAEIARREKIYDSYAWHKKLWECFPGMAEKKRTEVGFLTRVDPLEGSFRLWVLAMEKPERPKWCPPDGFAVNEIAPSFFSHRYYAFDLKANPVKTLVKHGPDGETLYQRDSKGEIKLRPNGKPKWVQGKRVPMVIPEELRSWLVRKGEARCRNNGKDVPGGFKVVEGKSLEIRPMVESYFRKKEHAAYHGGVQFRGTLEVTDQEAFMETYKCGVGSAKGFGFGLLLLAPVKL